MVKTTCIPSIIERSILSALSYGECEYDSIWPWIRDFFHLHLFFIGLWLGLRMSDLDFTEEMATGPFYSEDVTLEFEDDNHRLVGTVTRTIELYGHRFRPGFWLFS